MSEKPKKATETPGNLPAVDLAEIARRIKETEGGSQGEVVFFLGAGCSRTAGIPTAGDLVKDDWLKRLWRRKKGAQTPGEDEWLNWVSENFSSFDKSEENYGAIYHDVVEKLLPHEIDQQREFKQLIAKGDFNAGYIFLAAIMAQTPTCRTVLTTNFDNLLDDALARFFQQRAITIPHQAMISFAPEHVRDRDSNAPAVIVKLHNDVYFAPRNSPEDLEEFSPQIKAILTELLRGNILIFIGYGGRDKNVIEFLEKTCPTKDQHFDNLQLSNIYWLNREEPSGPIRDILTKKRAEFCKITNFDDAMTVLADQLDIVIPDEAAFNRRYQDMRQKIGKELDKSASSETEKDADTLFSYGALLHQTNRLVEAEDMYKRAIKADENHANNLGNYALLLEKTGRMAEAEDMYKRAIKADENDARNLGNYWEMLMGLERYDEAEAVLSRMRDINGFAERGWHVAVPLVEFLMGPAAGRQDALQSLKQLLQKGERCPTHNYEDLLSRHQETNPKEADFAEKLVAVATGKAAIEELNAFDNWRDQ